MYEHFIGLNVGCLSLFMNINEELYFREEI